MIGSVWTAQHYETNEISQERERERSSIGHQCDCILNINLLIINYKA